MYVRFTANPITNHRTLLLLSRAAPDLPVARTAHAQPPPNFDLTSHQRSCRLLRNFGHRRRLMAALSLFGLKLHHDHDYGAGDPLVSCPRGLW